jgi:hypothetical protein
VKDAGGNAFALEKIGNAKWHIGAALGFDVDNEHSAEDHRVWASSALDSLKNTLETPISEAD